MKSRQWRRKRSDIIDRYAPELSKSCYLKLREKLISQAIEGNAWNADHIIPVYNGGGQCQLDNLRTLCVTCHSSTIF